MDYQVTIEARRDPGQDGDVSDDDVMTMLDVLAEMGSAASWGPDRYGTTFTVSKPDAWGLRTIIDEATATFGQAVTKAGLPAWPIVELEVARADVADEHLAEPVIPELLGATEVAEMLGVKRQRITELQNRQGFPTPVARLAAGPVWTKTSLLRFAATWDRKPGRPPKDPLARVRAAEVAQREAREAGDVRGLIGAGEELGAALRELPPGMPSDD